MVRAFTGVFLALIAGALSLGWATAQSQDVGLDTRAPATDLELRATYAPVVSDAAPAVVNIYTKRVVTRRMRSVFDDPFFRDFFGAPGGGTTRQRIESSLGSGVIIDPTGVIVTNNHVIENTAEITVQLSDRREFPAEILLTDPQTDLAVLRIEVDDPLPTLEFADSDAAQVGDIVLAIGNPFGVGQTVTSGIVSALSRTAASVSDFQFFIQTDAAINPGNSGGALVDVEGRLLGVNTAIYSRSGGSNGIGFAIPGNLVRQVVSSALAGDNSVRRPWIGVSGTRVDQNLATVLGLERPVGVIVGDVFPRGPAAQAGLREEDVILSIDGQEVLDAEALRYRPATKMAGDQLAVTYLRNGREREAQITLALPPETPERDETLLQGRHPLHGVIVGNLSPALAEELGRSPMSTGVVVLGTEPNSPARRFRIGRNLTILAINGEEVDSVADVERALAASQSRRFLLTLADPRGRVSNLRLSI